MLGLQRGDEGKGRFVDDLADEFDIITRSNGGPNAGHQIVRDGNVIALHQIPSGILHEGKVNVMGNGVYLDPEKFEVERAKLEAFGYKVTTDNLKISSGAHLIMPHHILLDEHRENGQSGQGSTKSGIAQVAGEKYERIGSRTELIVDSPKKLMQFVLDGLDKAVKLGIELPANPVEIARQWMASANQIKPYIGDTVDYLNTELANGKNVLAEGAQAFWLDVDHGMYPYVTSSSTTTGGVISGLGISPRYIKDVLGVTKAIPSHVGGGTFVTKIDGEGLAGELRGSVDDVDGEFGATTGRPRQVGWLDLPMLRTATLVNGVNEIALAKLDVLQRLQYLGSIPVAMTYRLNGGELRNAPSSDLQLGNCTPIYEHLPLWTEDIRGETQFYKLPKAAQEFIFRLQRELGGVHISLIGTGPNPENVIRR